MGRTTEPRAGDFVAGLLLPVEGALALFADLRLLAAAAFPMLLTALATVGAAFFAFGAGDSLVARMWEKPSACSGCGVGAWIFSRLESLAWHAASFTVAALLIALAALVASRILAAPAIDALSSRSMRLSGTKPDPGAVVHGDRPLIPGVFVSVARALGRTAVLVVGSLAIAALGLIPGGAAVSTPLAFAWAGLWLFTDNVLYPLQWVGEARLADVRALVQARPALCAGYALATSALMLAPLASLVVTPAAVSGACRLVARIRAEAEPSFAPALD